MSTIAVAENAHAVAEALERAISKKDVAGVANVYSDHCVVWYNYDNKHQTRDESLAALTSSLRPFNTICYANIRRELTESGYVQQHVMIGELHGGGRIEVPCCHVGAVRNGKLVRLDAYFDPAPLLPVRNSTL